MRTFYGAFLRFNAGHHIGELTELWFEHWEVDDLRRRSGEVVSERSAAVRAYGLPSVLNMSDIDGEVRPSPGHGDTPSKSQIRRNWLPCM